MVPDHAIPPARAGVPRPGPPHRSRPIVIGLIGGVASGKSTVARMFGDLGCAVADADRFCHEALRLAEVRDRIVGVFGPGILDAGGEIVRAQLRPAFDQPDALRRLEAILHPVALARTRDAIEEATREAIPGLVVDAPLLLEAGLGRLCDVLVLVDVPEAGRKARARGRGMGEADWARREHRQLPIAEKRRRAHHTLDADAPPEVVRGRVTALWERLRARD